MIYLYVSILFFFIFFCIVFQRLLVKLSTQVFVGQVLLAPWQQVKSRAAFENLWTIKSCDLNLLPYKMFLI